jgi:hypothetical protein
MRSVDEIGRMIKVGFMLGIDLCLKVTCHMGSPLPLFLPWTFHSGVNKAITSAVPSDQVRYFTNDIPGFQRSIACSLQ